jgi:hypothetical protein
MNRIDVVQQRLVDHNTFAFGLCILQAWVSFLEGLLHVSCRMDFKKCEPCGKEQDLIRSRKETIKKLFRIEVGLPVDRPKRRGSGIPNNGNTACLFLI